MNNKYLLLFDFDQTITNTDSFKKLFSLITDNDIISKLQQCFKECKWQEVLDIAYQYLYKNKGLNIKDILSELSSIDLTKGMKELFEYIQLNKNKYNSYVITSNADCVVSDYLLKKDINQAFIKTIGDRAKFDYESNRIVLLNENEEAVCNNCGTYCKTVEYKQILYENQNTIYNKILFICDGKNDFCLASNLSEKDVVLIRKNYGLDQYLNNSNLLTNIKANVYYWESGIDILNYIKNI